VQDLDSKIRTGVAWSGLAQMGAQFVALVVSVILTRLLSPQDFGLVGMVLVFTNFASVFADMGFGVALVQKLDVTQHHKNAVFWISIVIGAVTTLIMAAAAPLIASFYNVPEVQPLAVAISLIFFINAFATVKVALLQKAMDFRKIAAAQLTSTVISGLVALYLAFSGFGVWSLVAMYIASAIVNVAVLWMITPWRPDFSLQWHALKDLSKFTMNLLGFSVFNYWTRNGDNLLSVDSSDQQLWEFTRFVPDSVAAGGASIGGYYKCDVSRFFCDPKRCGTGERRVPEVYQRYFIGNVSIDVRTASRVSILRLGLFW